MVAVSLGFTPGAPLGFHLCESVSICGRSSFAGSTPSAALISRRSFTRHWALADLEPLPSTFRYAEPGASLSALKTSRYLLIPSGPTHRFVVRLHRGEWNRMLKSNGPSPRGDGHTSHANPRSPSLPPVASTCARSCSGVILTALAPHGASRLLACSRLKY